ncbi:MAG: peptide ABC transporter substrate-binding protein, partial [Micrococcales bacterium]
MGQRTVAIHGRRSFNVEGNSMLSKQRSARSLSLLACGALALGACSTADTGEGSGGGDGETQDQTIAFAWEQEFEAYNGNTSSQNATKNTVVLNRVLTQFWEYDPEGQVAPYEPFGSFQKTSDDPLTVEYTINEDAKWSDGEPIDCDDMVLKWAAQSGKFKKDDKDVFSPAATTGYEDMQQPQCEDGDKKFTVVYDEPFADWSASFDQFIMPAHIVEKEAKVEDLVAAVTDKDMDAIGKAAKFWNEGWVLKAGELKPDIMPSSGPYMIDSWTAGQSLTLKANPQWWGDAPKASTIVFRFIAG